MAEKRKNSRRKGAVGERELSEVFRARGYTAARRGQQRSGLDQSDVIGGPEGFHFEAKRVEKLNVWDAFAQASRDAKGDDEPVVAMRRNRSGWLAVMRLDALLDMVQQLDELFASAVKHSVDDAVKRASKRYEKSTRKRPAVIDINTHEVIDVEREPPEESAAAALLRASAALDEIPPPTPTPSRVIVSAQPVNPQLDHAAVAANGTVILSPDDLPNVDSIPRVVEGADAVAQLRAKFVKEKQEQDKVLAELLRGVGG